MRYYTVSSDVDDDRLGWVYTPVDSDGKVIVPGRGRPQAKTGTSKLVDHRTKLGDCVYCVGRSLVVSSDAARLFREFKLPGDAQFIPVAVLSGKGKSVAEYATVVVADARDVLDPEHTEYDPLLPGAPLGGTRMPSLRGRRSLRRQDLDELDLLYGWFTEWVCSERLKLAIEDHHLSNFRFREIEVF